MPANYARVEVRFSKKNKDRLLRLRREIKDKTGKSVPMTTLVEGIVDLFFEKEELEEKACFPLQNG